MIKDPRDEKTLSIEKTKNCRIIKTVELQPRCAEPTTLAISHIRVSKALRWNGGKTGSRGEITAFNEHVTALAKQVEGNQASLLPVVTFFDSWNYHLANGFDMLSAAKRLMRTVTAWIYPGSESDAEMYTVNTGAAVPIKEV